MIRAKDLSKLYEPDTWALRDAVLSIEEGSWVTIMGPSGSGKTTLLNLIGCLDTPTKGSISIGGVSVTDLDQNELTRFRRDNIGLLFQQYHMIPSLTALENVMLAQYFHSVTDEADAVDALKKVGLGHRMDHLPTQLSGGEQQRVCIARALVNDQRLLLADEPTGNLDKKNGDIVLELMRELHSKGHTIVLVTHNPDIACLGDVLVEMLDGRVVRVSESSSSGRSG